jgi:hypothetical protein
MMSTRKAFNFLRSYYDVLEDIYDDKDKLTYLMAILDKQFKGVEPELTGIPKLCYRGQKHSIDSSRKGWEDKVGYEPPTLTIDPTHTIGGIEPPSGDMIMTTEGGMVHPYLQEQEKGKEKEKEQEYNKLDFFEIDITEGVNDDLFEDWLKTKKAL